jgi:hypothetical protein
MRWSCEIRRLILGMVDIMPRVFQSYCTYPRFPTLDILLFIDLIERLTREKAELVAALRSPLHEDFVDASILQFCASANARLQACLDFDAKRQFLVDHVERVIYNRYKITIAGSVPVQSTLGETKLQFRIEGEIDGKAVRSRPRTIRAEDGRKEKLAVTAAEIWPKGRSERYCGRAEAKL